MGKKGRNLIIVSLVLLVLSGILYVVLNQTEPVDDVVFNQVIELTDIVYGDIKSITFDTGDDKYTLLKGADEWAVADTENRYVLDQTLINKAVRKLVDMEATGIVSQETPEDLEPYGLNKPSVVTVEVRSGVEEVIYIGRETVRASYYVMTDKDPAVYEVDSATCEALTSSLDVYRIKNLIQPLNTMTLEHLIIDRGQGASIEFEAIRDYTEGSGIQTTASHRMTKPYEQVMEVNPDKSEALFNAVNTMAVASSVVEDMPQDLSVYGLAEPMLSIVIRDGSQDINLLIGDFIDSEAKLVYCMLSEGNTVYTVDGQAVEYLMNVKAYDLIFHFIMLMNIDHIDEIVVSDKAGKTFSLQIDRDSSDKDDDKSKSEETYFINEVNEVAEDQFKSVYQSLIGLSSDSPAEEMTSIEEATVSIEYSNRAEGSAVGEVALVPYNEFFYAAYANGNYRFVVAKEDVDEIFENLNRLTR